MSLHPLEIPDVPPDTIRVAKAAHPKGNIFIRMRDELGVFYQDQDFADLFSRRGQPAQAAWRLALITLMQFTEGLTDCQAAEAVRSRIDWKYALSLELTDPGFDFSVLSEFRSRLVEGGAEPMLLQLMLDKFKEKGLLKAGGKQRTDSTHVLATVRILSRLERVAETLRAALNVLAEVAAEWLRPLVESDWFERYSHRVKQYRLPKTESDRVAYGKLVGADGIYLLKALYSPQAPHWLRQLEAVQNLRMVWLHQYYFYEGELGWRETKDLPPTQLQISSPYDPDARYSKKRETEWVGYKVHLSETCDKEQVHLITNVTTTLATVQDVEMTRPIQKALANKRLLPQQHLVDMGYVDSELLLTSQAEYGVEVIGPVRPDNGWQALAQNGFAASDFKIDWVAKSLECPRGKRSDKWIETRDRNGRAVIHVKFEKAACKSCASKVECTRAQERREVTLRPKAQHETLQMLRQKQQTEEFKAQYALRSGIEGSLSEGVRTFGLRETRYVGLPKTRLQHIVIAASMNLVRMTNWLSGKPHAEARHHILPD